MKISKNEQKKVIKIQTNNSHMNTKLIKKYKNILASKQIITKIFK